jgi:hypothetical protein
MRNLCFPWPKPNNQEALSEQIRLHCLANRAHAHPTWRSRRPRRRRTLLLLGGGGGSPAAVSKLRGGAVRSSRRGSILSGGALVGWGMAVTRKEGAGDTWARRIDCRARLGLAPTWRFDPAVVPAACPLWYPQNYPEFGDQRRRLINDHCTSAHLFGSFCGLACSNRAWASVHKVLCIVIQTHELLSTTKVFTHQLCKQEMKCLIYMVHFIYLFICFS